MYISNKFGDSEKSTAWMPLGIILYAVYWAAVLFGYYSFIILAVWIASLIIREKILNKEE